MEEMDKLLEDLQKVNVEFNNQLSKYEALIYQTRQTNEKLEKYTDSNRDKVDRLCIRVEKKLEEINGHIAGISEECKELFNQYSVEIAALNDEERASFSNMLLEELNQYKNAFLQDVLGDYQKILQVFMDKIQKEAESVASGQRDIAALTKNTEETNQELITQIHGLRVIVNGCLDAINHSIGTINDKYLAIFSEFSAKVNVLNEEERKRFVGEVSQSLEQYKKDFGIYDTLLQDSHRTNQELTRLTLQNVESLQEMEVQIQRKLEQTEGLLEHISNAYEDGFDNFAKDVSALNSREKESFVVAVRSVLEDYRFTFGNEIESKAKEMNALFQKTLIGVCNNFSARNQEYQKVLDSTKESNARLHQDLEKKVAEIQGLTNSLLFREKTIKEALNFLKEDYKNTVWQYVQELERNNVQDRELLIQTMLQNVNLSSERFLRQIEGFRNERNTYLQQMEQMLEEERRDRESMLNRQAEAINLLKREQEALKRQLTQNQEGINRYQTVTGTISVALLLLCVLLLLFMIQPKVFAIVGVIVIVGLGVGITVCRKQIIQGMKKIYGGKRNGI